MKNPKERAPQLSVVRTGATFAGALVGFGAGKSEGAALGAAAGYGAGTFLEKVGLKLIFEFVNK